jgi:LuxR family transcriptional regulator, maltose regulon positive regulatory protein
VTIASRGEAAERGAPSTAAARLAVLPTKLQPPYRRPGIIDRARLVTRMRGIETPMVALIAPAGYGKSTALAAFVEADGRSTAWYSADERDRDPATLVRGLVAAIDRVHRLPSEVIAAAEAPGRSIWTVAVPRLAAALIDASPTFTLVVDDLDRVDDPEGIAVVLALADQLHGATRVLSGGRTVGALPLARLAAEGRLAALGRDELACDITEAGDLLEAVGLRLPDEDVRRLTERTEGWATGIYLASLADDPRGGRATGLSPTAPERLIEEYLRTEVLAPMAAADADLILRSSILDRVSGPLCDAVLERTGSAADLDRLERTNLLLIALDTDRQWFRYHHLLGDLLRRELERQHPEAVAELSRRAAAWHERHGFLEAALEYAMAANDEDRAARLTEAQAQAVLNAGRLDTVRRWLAWFDEREAGHRHPRLANIATMAFVIQGNGASAARWADIADAVEVDERDPLASGLRGIARVMLARDGVDGLIRDSTVAMDHISAGNPWRLAAIVSKGIALQLLGDGDRAEDLFTQAVALWDEGSAANIAVCMATIQLAANALERGDRRAAETHVRKGRGVLISNGLSEEPIAAAVDALDARIAVARGAVELARADLAHAQRLRPHLGISFPWLAIRARLDLIRAHVALGDTGGARTIMGEVRDMLKLRPDMGTLVVEANELEARLSAIRGGVAGASSLTVAEIRLLPLLTTHLSFREIGERLYISQNTVKTQAISIYRKLDATSRGEAIQRAVAMGLLESATGIERFIPAG